MGWRILRRFRTRSVEQDARGNVSLSHVGRNEEATEREEYALPDRGESAVQSDRFLGLTGQAAQAALNELDEFKPPRDLSP
ncbi:MAG TPA: hypothetical protein VMT69_03865 [Kineosporiaceae bacterium]|nr:hypothetical protein [Kineosporiaceae bacterium]